jgi:hypothetical protein
MSYRSFIVLVSAAVLATVQFSAAARADTPWSFFSLFGPYQPEAPKVTTRVAPTAAPRRARVVQQAPRTAEPACRTVQCGTYLVVGLGF